MVKNSVWKGFIYFMMEKPRLLDYSDMRVQLKKKRRKVRIANFISVKRLPNAAGGLGGAVSPPVHPGLSPGGGKGGKAPGRFHVFSSKNALD